MPSAFISCEKLIQLRALLLALPSVLTVVPTPFLRISRPSFTNRLMACLRVLRDILSSCASSTSLGRMAPERYFSVLIIWRRICSACT